MIVKGLNGATLPSVYRACIPLYAEGIQEPENIQIGKLKIDPCERSVIIENDEVTRQIKPVFMRV